MQTGRMDKPGPWMDPGVPVCPGYPAETKRFGIFESIYVLIDI